MQAGCAAGRPLPLAFHASLGPQRPADEPALVDDLAPLAPPRAVFGLYEGGEDLATGAPRTRIERTIELDPSQRRLRISQSRLGATESNRLVMETTLVQQDGGWAMTRSVTPDRGVITDYDPPMLVYPARIEPGARLTQSVKLTVHPLSDPERVQSRGTATNTIELAGRQMVRTAAGEIEALRLRATFEGAFGVARVRRVTDSWHAPQLGLVAEETHERVTALGAPVSAIDRALLLIAAPARAPAALAPR